MTAPRFPYTPPLERLRRLRADREAERREQREQRAQEAAATEARSAAFFGAADAIDEGFRTATAPERPYETTVPANREGEFQDWIGRHGITDLDHPDSFYDYRGAFLAGEEPDARRHWTDRFKQPGHPTFSAESQYAPKSRPLGPRPREGMRPSRRPPPTADDLLDPYANESPLARSIAHIRYQGPLSPFMSGPGKTAAKVMRTAYGLAGKVPVVGRPFRALEEDLERRLQRDEAQERVVRERHMSPAARLAADLGAFAFEAP